MRIGLECRDRKGDRQGLSWLWEIKGKKDYFNIHNMITATFIFIPYSLSIVFLIIHSVMMRRIPQNMNVAIMPNIQLMMNTNTIPKKTIRCHYS